MAAQQISLHSSRLDAPAVSTLIHHAGVQHDPVLAGRRHGTAVRFADLADGGNFIGTGAQLSGQGNLIPISRVWILPKWLLTPRLWPARATVPSQILVSVKWPAPLASVLLPVP